MTDNLSRLLGEESTPAKYPLDDPHEQAEVDIAWDLLGLLGALEGGHGPEMTKLAVQRVRDNAKKLLTMHGVK